MFSVLRVRDLGVTRAARSFALAREGARSIGVGTRIVRRGAWWSSLDKRSQEEAWMIQWTKTLEINDRMWA